MCMVSILCLTSRLVINNIGQLSIWLIGYSWNRLISKDGFRNKKLIMYC